MCRRIGEIHVLFISCSVQRHRRGRLSGTEEMADGFQLHKSSPYDEIIIDSVIYPVRKAFPWRRVCDQEAVDIIEMQEKK